MGDTVAGVGLALFGGVGKTCFCVGLCTREGGLECSESREPCAFSIERLQLGFDACSHGDGVEGAQHCPELLQAHFPDTTTLYWRDKQVREIDFILPRQHDEVDVIECKWSSKAFDATALGVFRSHHPKGKNYLLTPSTAPAHAKRFGAHEVMVCNPSALKP
jgi:hypothetical protein